MAQELKAYNVVAVHKEVREMSWDAFRATGLLTFTNGFLHIFGWANGNTCRKDGE